MNNFKSIRVISEADADEYILDDDDSEEELAPRADGEAEFVDLHTAVSIAHPVAGDNQFKSQKDQAVTKREKLFTSTPYILNFQLNVYAKSQDDSLQIVEQILPFFAPQYTISVKPFSDIPSLVEDVPITLTSVTMQDDYEGAIEQRRTIIYTLDFEMKIAFHGPLNENRIIRDVRSNLFLQNAGLSDSDVYLETIKVVPNPTTVSADSDYGFTETFLDSAP